MTNNRQSGGRLAAGACRAFFEIRVNGEQTGGGELSTSSTVDSTRFRVLDFG